MVGDKPYKEGDEGLCEICSKNKGIYGVDPYTQELYGETVWIFMCNDCYNTLCDDV